MIRDYCEAEKEPSLGFFSMHEKNKTKTLRNRKTQSKHVLTEDSPLLALHLVSVQVRVTNRKYLGKW